MRQPRRRRRARPHYVRLSELLATWATELNHVHPGYEPVREAVDTAPMATATGSQAAPSTARVRR